MVDTGGSSNAASFLWSTLTTSTPEPKVMLKRLTYNRGIRKFFRRFGLETALVPIYYRLTGPKDDLLRLEVGGIDVRFQIHSPQESRMLESMGGEGSERHILELFIDMLRPGDVVYDIGSNIGLYAVILAKAVGETGSIVAFEPESQSYAHLCQNLTLNHLHNVRPFQIALGDYTGQASFDRRNYSVGHTAQESDPAEDITIVEVVQGDHLVNTEGLPAPRAVKIDVEGYEYRVINGLSRTLQQPSCELVCCEIHPKQLTSGVTPESIIDTLKSFGFGRVDTYQRWDTFHAVCWRD